MRNYKNYLTHYKIQNKILLTTKNLIQLKVTQKNKSILYIETSKISQNKKKLPKISYIKKQREYQLYFHTFSQKIERIKFEEKIERKNKIINSKRLCKKYSSDWKTFIINSKIET